MPDVRTHSMGVMCSECKAVLVESQCSCGERHGYGYQGPSEWAGRTWPKHPCFLPPGEATP